MRNCPFSLPNSSRHTRAPAAPSRAGKCFFEDCHCPMAMTMNRAVMAKSIPSVLILMRLPATEPMRLPAIQYSWSSREM